MAFYTSPPRFRLNNNTEIPILGLGTFKTRQYELYNTVLEAIDIGYRHFDTAFAYGNERELGDACRAKISQGKITREDLYIVSKLANQHHDPHVVEYACRKSLNSLRLGYIDLYLMHMPIGEKFREEFDGDYAPEEYYDYLDTWIEMEKLVENGFVKSIGVSNFNSEQLQRILDNCTIKPVVNQIECHPGFPQKQLIKFCRQRNIDVVAYCPLGRPDPERKVPQYIYGKAIKKLAHKYGRTPAQLTLRYVLQIGAYPIPRATKTEHLLENFTIFDFIISKEDMLVMDSFNGKCRLLPFRQLNKHKYYPFNIKY